MPRTEGLKPIGDSIRKIIDKVMEERKKRKRNRPIRTQPKLPGLNKGGGADMGAAGERTSKRVVAREKMKRVLKGRSPQSRNKMQPSRSMSIDTTTGISKMKDGGICRGAGAAIKGTKFQGVF